MKGIHAAVDGPIPSSFSSASSFAGAGYGSRGMESGKLGFEVADVGRGGKASRSEVSPGTRSATTFWIMLAFLRAVRMVQDEIEVER